VRALLTMFHLIVLKSNGNRSSGVFTRFDQYLLACLLMGLEASSSLYYCYREIELRWPAQLNGPHMACWKLSLLPFTQVFP
jgi:hypothetical protein